MESLRVQLEMQDRPQVNVRATEDQQQQQQQGQDGCPDGVSFRGVWRQSSNLKILVAVATVALLAVAGTVAIFATSSPDSSGFPQESAMLSDPAFAPARVRSWSYKEPASKINKPKQQSIKARTSKDFEEVEEPLEHVRGHSHERDNSVSHKKVEPVQPAAGYELIEEPIEAVEEHDSRNRKSSHDRDGEIHHPQMLLASEVVQVPQKKEEETESQEADEESVEALLVPQQTEVKTESHDEKRYSTRLASSKNDKGIPVCETPECAVEAAALVESMDLSINPCDDFYNFACGGYINKNPQDASTFGDAAATMDKRLHLTLEQPAAPDAPAPLHMTKDHYQACMDTDTMDAVGLEPLVKHMNEEGLGGWPMTMDNWDMDNFQFEQAIANLRRLNVQPIVALGIDTNLTDTSEYILYADVGNVPYGYRSVAQMNEEQLEAYRKFMLANAQQIRDYLGSSITDEDMLVQVEELVDFEVKYSKMLVDDSNLITTYYVATTVADLQSSTDLGTPGVFSLLTLLRVMFTGTDVMINDDERVSAIDGPYFTDLSNLLAEAGPRTLGNFLGWFWVYELGQETTYAMRNLTRGFQNLMIGEEQDDSRIRHCMSQVNYDLGWALSRDYVDEFFPGSAKSETEELVEDIRSSFMSLLDENTWMQPEDLEVAKGKLIAIDPFVAYPEWIMDDQTLTDGYEGLHIESGTFVDNLYNSGKWMDYGSLASLRDTPEHSFVMPPTIVNAFYNPGENTITILAGILQRPFYAHNSLAAINYGGIGMVIGHEMTHGFDNSGRQFDKDGNYKLWWSDETIASFNEKAQCFVDQYDKFVPPELIAVGLNQSVHGQHTLGENIADNGGIREAYKAYQLYKERYGEEPRLPGLDEFTPDHIFYLANAQVWCENPSPARLLAQLAYDPHSPGRFRILGPFENDQEFSRIWNCPTESTMNRGEESCILW